MPKHPSLRALAALAIGFALAFGLTAIAHPADASTRHNWTAVAKCESGKGGKPRWNLPYGLGSSTGGLQITAGTWRAHGGRRYAPSPHQATRAQQIRVAESILRAQGRGAWPYCGRFL